MAIVQRPILPQWRAGWGQFRQTAAVGNGDPSHFNEANRGHPRRSGSASLCTKDFKIQALDNWKHGKPYAMLVCPVYQLPSRTSQIYQQAIARSVCVYTYTHLACHVQCAERGGARSGTGLLHDVFSSVEAMLPTKNASEYWQAVNGVLLNGLNTSELWRNEKIALLESIEVAREDALRALAEERARIMCLSRQDAIREVLDAQRLGTRTQAVEAVSENGILNIGA